MTKTHYVVLDSATQAVARVALRVLHGGHDVPEADLRRRFQRSRMHFAEDYLPLADEWVLWDNSSPPHQRLADSTTHRPEEISAMLESSNAKEDAPVEPPEFVRIGLEASRVATLKWLDFYRRMGIEVTPAMTLVKKCTSGKTSEHPSVNHVTGETLRGYFQNGGSGVSGKYLDSVGEAATHDPIPDEPRTI